MKTVKKLSKAQSKLYAYKKKNCFSSPEEEIPLPVLGFDHERLTFRFQGRYHRLTDIHGNVVKDILA